MVTNELSNWHLGTSRGQSPKTGAGINAVRRLKPAEAKKYDEAAKELRDWIASDTFKLIEVTYHRFRLGLGEVAKIYQQGPPASLAGTQLAINADFLSFLGMMRLYLDHTETKLKRSTKDTAPVELEVHKKAASSEFDSVFAYRFASKLRNYAQHCGLPISGFNASSSLGADSSSHRHEFRIFFNRDFLLKSYSDGWGARVKADLEAMPVEFDALEIADDLMKALRRIQGASLAAYQPRLLVAAKVIDSLADEVNKEQGAPSILKFEPPKNGGTISVTIDRMPLDLGQFIKDFRNNE